MTSGKKSLEPTVMENTGVKLQKIMSLEEQRIRQTLNDEYWHEWLREQLLVGNAPALAKTVIPKEAQHQLTTFLAQFLIRFLELERPHWLLTVSEEMPSEPT